MKKIPKAEFINELSKWGKIFFRTDEGFLENNKLSNRRPSKPPKKFIIPQEEIYLLFYKPEQKIVQKEIFRKEEKKVLFGLYPCDAKSIEIIDLNFLKDPKDPYYVKRRESLLLVTEACAHLSTHCFCTSLGDNPFDRRGDIFTFAIKEYYLAEPLSDRGREAILWNNFANATEDDRNLLEKAKKEIDKNLEQFDFKNIHKILYQKYEDKIWNELAFKCVNCGACTFYCPTCYCFDVQDVERTNWGYRERVWDSCMFTIYSQETSGHNPRSAKMTRLRNKVMHKFAYCQTSYGEYGCVGCGRCIDICPVGFDIRETLKTLKLEADHD